MVESFSNVNDLASQAPLSKVNRRGDKITLGGVPLTSVFSRLFTAESGRTSYRFVLSEGLAQAVVRFRQAVVRFRQAVSGPAIDNLLDEALLDPKLAAQLAARHNKANDRRAAKTLAAIATRAAARAGRGVATSDYEEADE